jgi:hypothetical protein
MNPRSKWRFRLKAVLLIFPIGIALAPAARAVEAAPQTIQIAATIQVPGNPLKSFDISWVDPASHRYYLADRSNSWIDGCIGAKRSQRQYVFALLDLAWKQ